MTIDKEYVFKIKEIEMVDIKTFEIKNTYDNKKYAFRIELKSKALDMDIKDRRITCDSIYELAEILEKTEEFYSNKIKELYEGVEYNDWYD